MYKAYPVGNYRAAPIDQFGNETPTWHRVQNANNQISKLSPYLLKLKSDDVYHFGAVPAVSHGPTSRSLVKSIDGNFLVGDFTHKDGSRYVMLVNKDLKYSAKCWPKFADPNLEAEKVSPYTGAIQPLNHEDRWVAPGQGMLLKLTKKKL
jgi:hypothetical protein